MSRKQSVRAQLLRKLQLCQMKILPSPGFTPKLKAEYIESMVVSEGVGRSQAAEAWNQSSQKRNILSTVSVPELRRRRFIEKGCDHNPWASWTCFACCYLHSQVISYFTCHRYMVHRLFWPKFVLRLRKKCAMKLTRHFAYVQLEALGERNKLSESFRTFLGCWKDHICPPTRQQTCPVPAQMLAASACELQLVQSILQLRKGNRYENMYIWYYLIVSDCKKWNKYVIYISSYVIHIWYRCIKYIYICVWNICTYISPNICANLLGLGSAKWWSWSCSSGKRGGVLMLLVRLLCFNSRVPQNLNVEFCEFFAGQGQISLALWSCGARGSSHDLLYSNLMDLCSPHGFAFLDWIQLGCGHMRWVWYSFHIMAIASSTAGNKRSVEHSSRSLLHVWHLLQLIHEDATWLVIATYQKLGCSC